MEKYEIIDKFAVEFLNLFGNSAIITKLQILNILQDFELEITKEYYSRLEKKSYNKKTKSKFMEEWEVWEKDMEKKIKI